MFSATAGMLRPTCECASSKATDMMMSLFRLSECRSEVEKSGDERIHCSDHDVCEFVVVTSGGICANYNRGSVCCSLTNCYVLQQSTRMDGVAFSF